MNESDQTNFSPGVNVGDKRNDEKCADNLRDPLERHTAEDRASVRTRSDFVRTSADFVRQTVRPVSGGVSKVGAQEKANCAHRLLRNRSARIVLRVTPKFKSEIELYCELREFTLTDFVEMAATEYMERRPVGAQRILFRAPNDEMMIDLKGFRTSSLIIKLYYAFNIFFNKKTIWKPADDKIGVQYNETDIRIVEIGILATQINKIQSANPRATIHSFSFYAKEIDNFLYFTDRSPIPESHLSGMLEQHRRTWQKLTGRDLPTNGE